MHPFLRVDGFLERLQRGTGVLRFFRRNNDTTIVVAAMGARPMLQFLFVTIRAFLDRRRGRLVVRPAFPAAGLGMAAFRIWHLILPLNIAEMLRFFYDRCTTSVQ